MIYGNSHLFAVTYYLKPEEQQGFALTATVTIEADNEGLANSKFHNLYYGYTVQSIRQIA